MLSGIGLRAEWTTSGKEAVLRATFAKENGDDFHVYIIDWLMPDMNGVEVVRKIRKIIGEVIPIIILTAYDWSDIEKEAKEKFSVSEVEDAIQSSSAHGSIGLINSLAQLFVDDVITLEQAKSQIEEKNVEILNRTIMQLKIKKNNSQLN